MSKLRWVLLGLAAFALASCSYQNPYLAKRRWQQQQARNLKPAELEQAPGTAWRRTTALKIRIYRDAAYANHQTNLRQHLQELIEHANEVLQVNVSIRLQLEEVRELPNEVVSTDLRQVIEQLHALDQGDGVEFVLALVGQNPIMTYSFHELGMARWLGKHLAMRSMDDAQELQQLTEGLDTLSVEQRAQLYAQRKQHKQTAVLLHEIGHALGAMHTRDPDDLMHPNYRHSVSGFAEPNLAIMGYTLEERTAEPDQRDPATLAKRLKTYLTQSQWQGWVDGEREDRLKVLSEALDQATAARQAAVLAGQEARPTPQAPVEDLTGLTPEDREKYQAIEVHRREQRVKEAYALVTELADRYPEIYAVQQKACELGMAFRVQPQFIVRYCGKMSELQKAARQR